jgi:hypothetical protein
LVKNSTFEPGVREHVFKRIPALGRLRQENQEFKASLGYIGGTVSKSKINVKL